LGKKKKIKAPPPKPPGFFSRFSAPKIKKWGGTQNPFHKNSKIFAPPLKKGGGPKKPKKKALNFEEKKSGRERLIF